MRIALGIEYHGGEFCGWQTQPSRCGVQDALERALGEIAGEKIATICAGRTDAGVHALEQVVHFDCNASRPDTAWVRGTNTSLPSAAVVTWMREVPAEFNARYSALERRYRYVLLNHPVRPALNHARVGWFHAQLNIPRMREAAMLLTGEHDFSAFRSAECQAKSPVRDLRRIEITQSGDYVVFEVAANAFLHHMVRNIVGSLTYVGKGKYAPEWIAQVLAGRDRAQAAPTFDAAGLYLAHVSYDAKWGLPQLARRAWFDEH
jgi:tRNA pseudouridine38-40 synthase